MSSAEVARMPSTTTTTLASVIARSQRIERPEPLSQTATPPNQNSSPETRPIDVQSPIPEEDEDETASETVNEPITPVDTQPSYHLDETSHGKLKHDASTPLSDPGKPPLLLNTAPTPPQGSPSKPIASPQSPAMEQVPPPTPSQARPTSSREPGIKRGFSQFFRRSNSHAIQPTSNTLLFDSPGLTHGAGGSDVILSSQNRSSHRMSIGTSPTTTRSNTPPSPEILGNEAQRDSLEPSNSQFFNETKKNRSLSGLGIRQKVLTFGATPKKPQPRPLLRHRATSVDLDTLAPGSKQSQEPELTRHPWGFPAEAGTGLKARRMSLNLPDDFTVDVVDLHKEFSDQSRILGRRGKTLGRGATSTVTLMTRKGGSSELYAVKEFRGKTPAEKEEDYEKKVKSEYSIAKSLHHPNIVETIRLCTHQGRWNHVMEYCQEGDLFNLVQKGYLKNPDRLNDRLCLFKQLVQGIYYLHEHGIAHRDIKLENLLMTNQSKLKITDFGVSEVFCGIHPGLRAAGGQCGREMKEVRLCAPGICGSMPYIAPEVVVKNGKLADDASQIITNAEIAGEYDPRGLDVWSSAIVMLHIVFGGALWPRAEAGNRNYDSLIKGWQKWEAKHAEGEKITESDYPHVAAFDQMVNPPALRRILVAMLHPNPKKRATIAEVAKNRWVKNIECCQVETYEDPTGAKIIDASKSQACAAFRSKVVQHNHLPPANHKGHHLVRLPGSTHMH
jgi:protein-serine/threonine kinase